MIQLVRPSEVIGVKVIDRYRLSIKLINPYSGFLLNLGQFSTCILAKEDVEQGKINRLWTVYSRGSNR